MNRTTTAWLLMVTAVGIHVLDEALTGFLPWYNAQVLLLRERLGFFPAPTFTFRVWITGLTLAVVAGFGITPLVNRGGKVVRIVAGILAVLMIGNALNHMLGSAYVGRVLPGFWSSPCLLATSGWMLVRVLRAM
jgi:hypothetical protein